MNIDWKEYEDKNHILSWFLVEVMGEAGIEKFGKFDSSKLNVELKINGIEVSILPAMEHLQTQLKNIKEAGRKAGIEEAKNIFQDNIERLFCVE